MSENVVGLNGKPVALRDGPLLNDIPGLLRKLADDIEAKADGHEETDSVTVLIPVAGDYPQVYGFGNMNGQRDPLIVCEMAKVFLVLHQVRRE